jgi:hypothetical protein
MGGCPPAKNSQTKSLIKPYSNLPGTEAPATVLFPKMKTLLNVGVSQKILL